MLHFALLWLFVGLQGIPAPEGVKVAEERLVLKTPAGVIVIALYPEVAPQSVAQMLKLAREGIFDGICIPRIAPGFLLQFSAAELDRQPVLPASLRTLIRPLPAEFSKLKHVRGMVNLGRLDEDVNSATTSFCILLGDAPHLDGKYTIFGHVEYGMDVVEELLNAPRDGTHPLERIDIDKVEVLTGSDLRNYPPPRVKAVFSSKAKSTAPLSAEQIARGAMERQGLLTIGIFLMIVCSLINVFVPKLRPGQMQTLNLTIVLIGAFLVVALLQPLSLDLFHTPGGTKLGHGVAIVIFFGLLGVFRLMSRFESAS